jgi:O-acetyl-ADP-ribose deacetylase (regulator of RNase III)
MNYNEINGDLIKLAKLGYFDVILHGCNCFNTQRSGLAPQMVKHFGTDTFPMEAEKYKGDINKLGTIDYMVFTQTVGTNEFDFSEMDLTVVNAYTQYSFGTDRQHLDYDALRLCLRKINHIFKGKKIGLPQIGSGLAGGSWTLIKKIIQEELTDVITIVVIYSH